MRKTDKNNRKMSKHNSQIKYRGPINILGHSTSIINTQWQIHFFQKDLESRYASVNYLSTITQSNV